MMSNKKTVLVLLLVGLVVGVFMYRTGREDGNAARDAYHLDNDFRGDITLACESQIEDNQRYRNLYINFDKHFVRYSPELSIDYNRQSVFFNDSGYITELMSKEYYVSVNNVTTGIVVSISRNASKDSVVDYLSCEIVKER